MRDRRGDSLIQVGNTPCSSRILEGNSTREVPFWRCPFPFRYSILHYVPPGYNVSGARNASLSPQQRGHRGVPGRAGAAVTQEAAGPRCGGRGEGAAGRGPIRTRGVSGAGRAGTSRFPRGPAQRRLPSSERAREARRGLGTCAQGSRDVPAGPGFPPRLPRPFTSASFSNQTRLRRRSASALPAPRLPGSARSARRPVALRLVSAGPAGAPHPGRAAVMPLPPLRPGRQLAAAGVGARSSLAGTPPWPVLSSRGGRGAPGPGAA